MNDHELKRAIDMAEYHLRRAESHLHDTGDIESEELDAACNAVEVALRKLEQVDIAVTTSSD